jgi:TIR domain
MAKTDNSYDVFVAYDHRDRARASTVVDVLQSYGLKVFFEPASLGAMHEDAIWEALVECKALVLMLPLDANSSWFAFEIGAASAWNKPIYAVSAHVNTTELPFSLKYATVLPISRADEIARAVLAGKEPIASEDQRYLEEAYQKVGVAVDQLALQPQHLTKLVKEYFRRSGKKASGEQVLLQLLRNRKRGILKPLKNRTTSTVS